MGSEYRSAAIGLLVQRAPAQNLIAQAIGHVLTFVRHVPGEGFTFAIRVGAQQHLRDAARCLTELRDDGSMGPRLWDPETAVETTGRIREYQYSTVMDYGNNFVVTDTNGIGHYDRAAIKMGYGDMVEVFDGAARPGDARK